MLELLTIGCVKISPLLFLDTVFSANSLPFGSVSGAFRGFGWLALMFSVCAGAVVARAGLVVCVGLLCFVDSLKFALVELNLHPYGNIHEWRIRPGVNCDGLLRNSRTKSIVLVCRQAVSPKFSIER
jgi:hypothetical protein